MFDLMTREQRRAVEAMRSSAADFASIARSRDEFVGGMQWLKVKGNEYLSRYRRDPTTGEQKSTSLGRRSPETEALHSRFMTGRAELDQRVEEMRPTLTEQARMAKALRLTRTPSEIADVARAIGLSDMIDHVVIVGDAAAYAYELELGALLPREILPSDGMDLLISGPDADDVIDEIVVALRRGRVEVRRRSGASLWTDEGLKIRLVTMSMLDRSVERFADENHGGGDAARWALDQDPIRTIMVDRHGRTSFVSLPDPRAWCVLRLMAADMDDMSVGAREMSLELISHVAGMVRDRWSEPFPQEHVDGFARLAAAIDGDVHPPPRF